MPIGVIKFYNSKKGYGFIAQEQGEDIYFHISSAGIENPETLTPGQPVSFEIEEGTKGQQAKEINMLGTIDNQIPADKKEAKELTQKPIAQPKKKKIKDVGELYIEKQIRLNTPMVFETYSESISCTVKKHLTFDLELLCGEESRKISKLDVKYFYKQEYEPKVKATIQINEGIKAQELQPIKPIKERYRIPRKLLMKARTEKPQIQLVLRGGEIFLGIVEWFTPHEIKVAFPRGDIVGACDRNGAIRTRCENPASGGNVIAFSHAAYDFAILNGNEEKLVEESPDIKEKETQEPQEVTEKEPTEEPSEVKEKRTTEEQQEIKEREEVKEKIYQATITKAQAEQGIKAIIPIQDSKKIAIPLPAGVSDGNRFRVKNRNMIVVVSVEG